MAHQHIKAIQCHNVLSKDIVIVEVAQAD